MKTNITLSLIWWITRTTRTPAFWGYPRPPHDYPYHWVILDPKSKDDKVKVTNFKNSPKFQIYEFWNGHYTGHTFWSCLIRCANMKWIWWVLLKMPPHDYPYHWVILDPKSKDDKVKVTNFKNSLKFHGRYTRHTFWSCLIRCANMKWIRWVLLKIQSGHDSVHRRTDGQRDRRTDGWTDRRTRWYQYTPYQLRWSGGYN